jgi:hypothetical protein
VTNVYLAKKLVVWDTVLAEILGLVGSGRNRARIDLRSRRLGFDSGEVCFPLIDNFIAISPFLETTSVA